MVDIISKTSEGIKNSSKDKSELVGDIRKREPRAFYGHALIIRSYVEMHANLLSLVPSLSYPMYVPGS